MTASVIVIFYATGSKQIRSIAVPDSDDEVKRMRAPVGESMLVVPQFSSPQGVFDPANNQYVIDSVRQATGVTPPNPACAVVNDLNVVDAMIAADVAIDTIPGKTLVQSYDPEIAIGCTYDPLTKLFTIPGYVIPGAPPIQVPPRILPRGIINGPVL